MSTATAWPREAVGAVLLRTGRSERAKDIGDYWDGDADEK